MVDHPAGDSPSETKRAVVHTTRLTPSADEKANNPLLPKISFLILLTITLLAAITFMLVRGWIEGSHLATAGLFTVGMLGLVFVVFALLAAVAWIPAAIMNDRYSDLNWGNPFGDEQLPKQIIRPRDPEA